eukprot:5905083-Amphidinium_carterae.2
MRYLTGHCNLVEQERQVHCKSFAAEFQELHRDAIMSSGLAQTAKGQRALDLLDRVELVSRPVIMAETFTKPGTDFSNHWALKSRVLGCGGGSLDEALHHHLGTASL